MALISPPPYMAKSLNSNAKPIMEDHQPTTPDCTINPYNHLQIIRNSSGSISRLFQLPNTPPAPDPNSSLPVLTKDVEYSQRHGTWLRMFRPRRLPESPAKLPLVVYFHAGGFILFSAATTYFHDFCSEMAVQLGAFVVSVEYRLAPEHRLPAAYDDAVEALRWVKSTQEEWIREFVDISKCYLMGTSAGGNMAYHAGLRVAIQLEDFEPLKIRGLILHHPFFGGSRRTGSEIRLANNPVLPLSVCDLMWELSLPVGVGRDHEYCNPTVGAESDAIEVVGWRLLVTGYSGDPLIDRQKDLVEMLEKKGVRVESVFGEGEYHAVEVLNPDKAKSLYVILKKFIC